MFTAGFSKVPVTFNEVMAMATHSNDDIKSNKFMGYIDVYIWCEREPFIQTAEWMLECVRSNGSLARMGRGINFCLHPQIREFGVNGMYIKARLDKSDIKGMDLNWSGSGFCNLKFKLSLNLSEDQCPTDPVTAWPTWR